MSLTLTWAWSLALEDGVLPEEATEAGLLGAASFFRTRDLSSPFSGGEWAGLTRGVAGSYRVKWDRQRARLSKQTGGKPLACTYRSNKPGPHVQTQINILMHVHILLLTHTCTHFSFTCHPLFLCILCRTFCMSGKRNTASKHTLIAHNQYFDRLFGNVERCWGFGRQKRAVFSFVFSLHTEKCDWAAQFNCSLTSLETSTTKSSLLSPSLSWNDGVTG